MQPQEDHPHVPGPSLWPVGFAVGVVVLMIGEGPLDHLDHAPTLQFFGGKIGIDATAKGPLEGTREWPPEIEMDARTRELVDRRWSEYGIESVERAGNGRISQSSRRLLRR